MYHSPLGQVVDIERIDYPFFFVFFFQFSHPFCLFTFSISAVMAMESSGFLFSMLLLFVVPRIVRGFLVDLLV